MIQLKQQGILHPLAILRLPAVKARTGLSRSAIYLRVSEGTFPRKINLGPRSVGWLETDVQQWLEQRIEVSRRAQRQNS